MNKHALERLRLKAQERSYQPTVTVYRTDLDAILISHQKLGEALHKALNTDVAGEDTTDLEKVLNEEQGPPWRD